MSEDPYRPPAANLGDGDDVAPAGSHAVWKAFFWIALLLTVVSAVSVALIPVMTLLDWIDFAVSVVALAGLGGLAFQKALGRRRFWIAFFAFCTLWSAVYAVALPLLGVPLYGQVITMDAGFAISFVFTVMMLVALYVYALRAEHLWGEAQHPKN